MKSRDLGVLLFGLAGLYSLLLAFLGVAQLLMQVSASAAVVSGQLRIQATFVNGVVSVLLHLAFGAFLLGGRRAIALWLLGEQETAAAAGRRPAANAERGQSGAPTRSPAPGGEALGYAAAGVCFLAILLLARAVTALSYAASLLWQRGNTGDYVFWTAGGIVTDVLLALAGVAMVAGRNRLAAHLLAGEGARRDARRAGAKETAAAAPGDGQDWQLPAARFLGLAVLVWYLPELVSAASVFVKWWLRPAGFDLRTQAIERLPPAAAAVIAGLYFLLLFPAGLQAVRRRLRQGRHPDAPGPGPAGGRGQE
ncbi:MAG TPA: hypothetical protein VE075_02965 [Thermoanaerobaculia bacterium]|nr:hypothetical protein [Thermoanaerobaculia bacterium]